MLTTQNLNWIAGIVEGEGCFGYWKTPVIRVHMTDFDIIDRLSAYFKVNINRLDRKGNRKVSYSVSLYGKDAIGWMLTLWPLMGIRRRSKIEEVLQQWKDKLGPGKHWAHKRQWGKKIVKEANANKPNRVQGVEGKK